eukprot:GHVR01087719.1.p1 GENE.GHVR01087719.1~~GHVR01087719.1.p1  ORF type:complete len:138 (+),score=7.67 GHVR01087719.1:108-521(+)
MPRNLQEPIDQTISTKLSPNILRFFTNTKTSPLFNFLNLLGRNRLISSPQDKKIDKWVGSYDEDDYMHIAYLSFCFDIPISSSNQTVIPDETSEKLSKSFSMDESIIQTFIQSEKGFNHPKIRDYVRNDLKITDNLL